jgi:probable HAF family extracellular repeat protein
MSALRSVARFLAIALVALATVAQAASSKPWTVVDIGALGSRGSIPLAINNRGEVVGYSSGRIPGTPWEAYHPFVWSNGTMTDLGLDMGNPPGSLYAQASAINDKGVIVGTGTTVQVWTDGVRTPLSFQGSPSDINKHGAIAGTYYSGFNQHPFIYADGVLKDLGTLGGTHATAAAMNDKGVVVGDSQLPGNAVTHAFAYEKGVMTDLGSMGGEYSGAVDINSHGVIVGTSTLAAGGTRAFIYDRGGMRPLFGPNVAVPAGQQYVQAINDRGDVIGNIDNSAFVYEDGKLTILNTLPEVQAAGWATLFVMDINDRGWITGWGWRRDDPTGAGHGFVLIPH